MWWGRAMDARARFFSLRRNFQNTASHWWCCFTHPFRERFEESSFGNESIRWHQETVTLYAEATVRKWITWHFASQSAKGMVIRFYPIFILFSNYCGLKLYNSFQFSLGISCTYLKKILWMKMIHYPNKITSHLVTIVPMAPFTPKSTSKLRSALHFRYSIVIPRFISRANTAQS